MPPLAKPQAILTFRPTRGTGLAQPADDHHRRNRHRARQPRRRRDRRVHPDAAARRHRPEPRGQDHLHHRAGPQPPDRRPAAGLRADGRGPLHRRAAGGVSRRRDPALRLRAASRGADRQDAALAGVDAPHLAAAADAEVPVAELARGHRRARRLLNLDIVDYPGEWLLDLPLLGKTFAEWSARGAGARRGARCRRRTPTRFLDAARLRPTRSATQPT